MSSVLCPKDFYKDFEDHNIHHRTTRTSQEINITPPTCVQEKADPCTAQSRPARLSTFLKVDLVMALPRFFVDRPDADFVDTIELPPKAAHHAGRALRLAAGEKVVLFNGSGRLWTGPISFDGKRAFVTIEGSEESRNETPLHMTLVQAFVTPEKMDWIVEKAVELGVARIVLIPAKRSVTKLSGDRLMKRVEKCRETVRAACEQCGRNKLPVVEALSWQDALQLEADVKLFLAPAGEKTALPEAAQSVVFAVGPEGGFAPEEIEEAMKEGWQCALLGPRVLRTETAGLAAAVWLNSRYGDFSA